MPDHRIWRRQLLATTAMALLSACTAQARDYSGARPWSPGTADPPDLVPPGPWRFFTPEEANAVDAMVDRLIPTDALGAGGREAGCTLFIDRQLAGPFGSSERLYMRPPFAQGTPQQGLQSAITPAVRYRTSLAAIDAFARAANAGRNVAQLGPDQLDRLLAGLEKGEVRLDGADARGFFELLLQNTMEGFFADPVYGGNKDMVGWKLVGFPGARYDFRDHIAKHNQPYPLPPVGLSGRPEWTPKG